MMTVDSYEAGLNFEANSRQNLRTRKIYYGPYGHVQISFVFGDCSWIYGCMATL